MARISSKNQVTLPVGALAAAGLSAGDEVEIRVLRHGRLEIVRRVDVVQELAGILDDRDYPPGYLEEVRTGWE